MPQSQPTSATASGSGGVEKNPRRTAKSRNGCQVCKIKRLKCDETRPACDNCTKRGYDCPGYRKALKWSTKYEVLQPDEPDGQKTFHPSVEYHFSSIDPVTFGQASNISTEETAGGADGYPDVSEEIVRSPATTYLPHSQNVVGLGAHRPSCDWPQQWPSYPDTNHQRTMVSYSPDISAHRIDESRAVSDGTQTSRPQRSNSSEETTQWKSLLRAYYRMATPTISRSLQNDSTGLVVHYFRDICVLYSSFDSKLNPFRTVIGKLWDSSNSIFYAIQSMAAAHLANHNPGMEVQGLQMQRKAYECLQHELQLAHVNQQVDDRLLLTVLLLGMSSPWHEAGDLGMAHLNAARGLIYPRLFREEGTQTDEMARNDQFFAEALIYWEMCVAFVHKEPFTLGREKPRDKTDYNEARTIGTKVMPHPWTGVGPRAQVLFAEVGRLVRNYRAISSPLSYGATSEHVDPTRIITAAMEFEEELLNIRWPAVEDLVDVQDQFTSKLDFIMVAESTRCCALLEIYRVFPNILHNRLLKNVDITGPSSQFFFPFCGTLLYHDSHDPTMWLTSLACHILLDLIGSIPPTSNTRPLQLLIILTAAAELRLSGHVAALSLHALRARDLAMTRLEELSARVPSKPIVMIIKLVKEVWRRFDLGDDSVFWLDVMHENGWQTVIG
ncbi:unnamed protein product [Aureobasidium uvarum]|uniref:Zn(2)-C6 fungal-type domain-containing protein n=1 Tax=Aureobasidium uvarum TaxID=2773716 RepID=A0A9N8PS17_9PEZI|nr:unnamed protein product [Aureobasidium uvarum]